MKPTAPLAPRKKGSAALVGLLLLTVIASVACNAAHHIDLTVDVTWGNGSYNGTLSMDYVNDTSATLDELFFRLYPNAASIYTGASLEVTAATVDAADVQTAVYLEDTVVLVPLPSPLAPNDTVTVALQFSGRAAAPNQGGYGILTKNPSVLTLSAFYPMPAVYGDEGWSLDPVPAVGDAVSSPAVSTTCALTVDAAVDCASTGRIVSTTQAENRAEYLIETGLARDFTVVLLQNVECFERTQDGVTLRAWFSPATRQAAEVTLEEAAASLALFTELIGPLPYSEIDLVEAPLVHAVGVEFAELVLISAAYAQRPMDPFYTVIVAHEMVHQWFYNVVGTDPVETPWMDEALATYLSLVVFEQTGRTLEASNELRKWNRAYQSARGARPDLGVASPLYVFPNASVYSGLVYSGGGLFLSAVRSEIGDEAFFAGLGEYYKLYTHSIAPRGALLQSLEAACGCSLAALASLYGVIDAP